MEAPCRQEPLEICSEVLDLEQHQWTKCSLFALALEDFRSDLDFLDHTCFNQISTLPSTQVGTGEEGVDFVVPGSFSQSAH